MISYLLSIGIQSHNLAVEYPIAYHGLQHRADIVIFAKSKIQVLIECKKTEQPITQQTIAQVLRYNHVLQLSKTIITNGLEHYYFTLDTTKGWSTLQGLPDAEMLSENYE